MSNWGYEIYAKQLYGVLIAIPESWKYSDYHRTLFELYLEVYLTR